MRILHLTTEFPWPATSGGSVRTVSQLRILASLPEVESVTVLSVSEHPVRETDLRAFAACAPRGPTEATKLRVVPPVFHPVHLFDFKRYVPRVAALRVFRGVPYLAGKWDSHALRTLLRRELATARVDVVYMDHVGMARYLPEVRAERPTCRVVLDEHNVESAFFRQFAERQRGPKRLIAESEYRASLAFETASLRAVDAVVAISNEDAKQFKSLAGIHAHVVPMVFECERRPRARPPLPNFCYVGNLRWHPNVAGLDWFCREVWPTIRSRVPNATFEIAGVGLKVDAVGLLDVPAAWKVPGISTLGFVDDLEPLYARSLGMLAPVFGGSGVRVKMLEGFRAGMPVVTTPDGAFGLPLSDGKEALIAEDALGFAERVERLAKNDDVGTSVREGGYAYLEEHHSLRRAQEVMRPVLGIG